MMINAVADMVEFARADLVPPSDRQYDLIVANLSYIPSAAIPELPVAASFEPPGALDGGPDGLSVIGRLLDALPMELAPTRSALLEIGGNQASSLTDLASRKIRTGLSPFTATWAASRVSPAQRPPA